ncbi:MAG: serine/threonine protein kinase [Candidatus Obscuribacterales bacterium]|nr:serine/threonine protein kinase [Candidatus Obscuribacterales bacterium]
MAEAELSLSYREAHVAILHGILLCFVPVITFFVILCCVSLGFLQEAGTSNIPLFMLFLFLLLSIFIIGLIISSDRTVFLTRDGISLPFAVSPALALRSQHTWEQLKSIRLLNAGKRGLLELRFDNGSKARLKLDLLKAKEIESLIVSLDVWAGGSDKFPALLEARIKLNEESGRLELPGYTEIWEDELARRFGPSNFIPLEPGQVVKDLKIERQLAFGGLSAIYLAGNKSKEQFVLKEAVLPEDADPAMKAEAEKMLDREAKILSSLNHPSIARVYDNFIEGGRHYLLMELLNGDDLRRLIKEHGPQPEEDVIRWGLSLLEILDYLHSQNPPVIHRDLSPDNIILRKDGEPCLIDFGAANHFMGTATGTLIGKQAYIAPEQLRGKAETRSDLYAFACTLYFLLCGQEAEALAVAHPRELRPELSKEIDQIIADCTAQNADERPANAQSIAARLKQLQGAMRNV